MICDDGDPSGILSEKGFLSMPTSQAVIASETELRWLVRSGCNSPTTHRAPECGNLSIQNGSPIHTFQIARNQ